MTQHPNEISPHSTHSSTSLGKQSNIPVVYTHLDELIKQNDAQRQLLSELFEMLELPKSKPMQKDLIVSVCGYVFMNKR